MSKVQLVSLAFLIGFFLANIPTHGQAREVYFSPRMIPQMMGGVRVGVASTGQATTTMEFSSLAKEEYVLNNSVQITQSIKRDTGTTETTSFTDTVTPKSQPTPGGLLSSMADFITSGNPQKMINSFSNAIDYAIQPTNDDWKRVYNRSTSLSATTSNGVTTTSAQNVAKDFINQVKNSTTAEKKFDLNAGYIECAIRITNIGSTAVTLRNPTFALYFVGDNNQLSMQGVKRAYQNPAQLPEDFYLAAKGGSVDLTFRIDGKNYEDLFQQYASSRGVTLVFQPPQVVEAGNVVPFDQVVGDKKTQAIYVRVISDNYSVEAFVTPGAPAGMTIPEVFQSLDLDATMLDSANPAFQLKAVAPDENILGDKDPTSLSGPDLVRWRRWVLLKRNSQGALIVLKAGEKLKPGASLYAVQLTAKQFLGEAYAPVIFARKDTELEQGKDIILSDIPLQNGDRIELSNVRLATANREVVNYSRRLVHSPAAGMTGKGAIPFGTAFAPLQPFQPGIAAFGPPPPLPRIFFPLGAPLILHEPIAVRVERIASIREYAELDAGVVLDPQIVEEGLRAEYTGGKIEKFVPHGSESDNPWIAINEPNDASDFADPETAKKSFAKVKYVYIVKSDTVGAERWHFDEPISTFLPFLLLDPAKGANPSLPTREFSTHTGELAMISIGNIYVSNSDHRCEAFSGITDRQECGRWVELSPASYPIYQVQGKGIIGKTGLFKIVADVAVIRTAGR
jgi:hypothetical protein